MSYTNYIMATKGESSITLKTLNQSGNIPKGWNMVTMRDICSVRQGLQIPIQSRFKEPGAGRYLYITVKYLNSNNQKAEAEYIQDPSPRVICKKDDIILARTGATGKVLTNLEGVFHNNFFLIDYDRSQIDRDFLIFCLRSDRLQQEIKYRAGTTTIPDLNHGDFYSLYFIKPPLTEQKKIAEILGSVEESIAFTQAVIDQTRKVKQGLLQQLLTKGIGHTKFKESAIGKIPESWEVVSLGNVLIESRYGTSVQCNSHTGLYPVLRIPNVVLGEILIDDLKYATLSEEDVQRYAIKDGDILIVRTNGNPDYVGRSVVVSELDGTWLFASYLIRLRVNTEKVLPHYVHLALQNEETKNRLQKNVRTSAGNYNLNTQGLSSVTFGLPPLDEQKKIVEHFRIIDESISCEQVNFERVQTIKRGLMQDLLTGKVRVKQT